MTRKSRREIERKIAKMEPKNDTTQGAAFELETGEYVTLTEDPVSWDEVTFAIPYDLWHDGWGLDAPEEIHDPEAYDT